MLYTNYILLDICELYRVLPFAIYELYIIKYLWIVFYHLLYYVNAQYYIYTISTLDKDELNKYWTIEHLAW